MGNPVKIFLALLLVFAALDASAQFYLTGDDPGRVRWKQIETQNYKLIYPSGMDSLARSYGYELEKWRIPVGQSAGYLPGECIKGKMPVILHGYNSQSNGSVAWAPKRMDFYLSPDTYDPIPLPWITTLAIHEQRHASQMQTGLAGAVRPLGWFFGEMLNGAASGLYGGSMWMEGDAVVTETALTKSGRGRMDSFLNWYMVCFDNDDWRNVFRWRNESQRNYILDKYALGYVHIAGIRYNYNAVNITGDKLRTFSKEPWEWGDWFTVRRHTGGGGDKRFEESCHNFYDIWRQNADARAPYMESERLVEELDPIYQTKKLREPYTKYEDLVVVGDDTYAVQSGLTIVPGLVRINKNGEVTRLRPFSYSGGGLELSADSTKILWSETVRDPRWDLGSNSLIMSYDLASGKVRKVTREGQLYHPYPYKGGFLASDYDFAGAQSICFVDSTGLKSTLAKAEDGIQIVETVAVGDSVFASCISWDGFGIYRVCDGGLVCVLEPQPVTMRSLFVHEDKIYFTSDRNGVEELYSFDPASSRVCQLTSSRYGGRDYRFSEDGEELLFSASTVNGHMVSKAAVSELPVKEVDFSDIYHNPIADTLSVQEQRYNASMPEEVEISEEKPYRKIAHLFHLHSWAPVYFNYDNIVNMSYDKFTDLAALGLTGLFQNNLGTSVLSAGYRAAKNDSKWFHSAHLNWTYTGLYPVFELSLDVNDRYARQTYFNAYSTDGQTGYLSSASSYREGVPHVGFSALCYIPLYFNSKGWYRGLIPQVKYSVSNDIYDTAPNWYVQNEEGSYDFIQKGSGEQFPSQSLTLSARGYIVQATPTASIYPRWGIGAEAGVNFHIAPAGLATTSGELPMFNPMSYAYIYAYVPGLVRQQGLRLSAKYAYDLRDDAIFSSYIVNTLPRGLSDNSSLALQLCGGSRQNLLLTADYAIPVWSGDWAWGNFAYVKRFIFTPHFDYMLYEQSDAWGKLYSAGLDFSLDFTRFFWISANFQIGVRADYNGGDSFQSLVYGEESGSHWSFSPIFSLSF